jgi:GNAT superfamily N-acetyltransferase
MTSEPTIRLAHVGDIPSILSMIRELAIFEESLSSVQATESSLHETLIFAASPDGKHPAKESGYAKTFILVAPEGEVAGMALWFHNYSTWTARPGIYLEDLYVREKYRRRGYATLLLRELGREVRRIK